MVLHGQPMVRPPPMRRPPPAASESGSVGSMAQVVEILDNGTDQVLSRSLTNAAAEATPCTLTVKT